MTLVESLEALRVTYRGELEESELRLTCPQCHKRNLGFALGSISPILLAHCLSPRCASWSGPDILRRFGLPSRLTEDQAQAVRIYLGSPRREATAERAELDRLNHAYAIWLGLCSLSEAHQSHLTEDRGFRPAFIREALYRSWEPPQSLSIELDDYSGVPGLDSDGKPLLNSEEYKGIIVPVRGVGGKIEALKIRLDQPPPGGKKMRTFGSADCKGAYVVHVPVAVSPSKKVTVVEGELKADYCWQATHKATVGLPGVNGGIQSLRKRLMDLAASEVCLALDQDEPGQDATENLIRELHETYTLSVMMWDGARAKGLDDALLAGVEVREITALEWIEEREKKMVKPPPATSLPPGGEQRLSVKTYSGIQVLRGNFPAPPELVKTLLPTGLSLLAGKSKIGKSYLLLDLCLSVATGSPLLDLDCEEGKVVYLALEDTPRSLQQRMQTLHSVKSFDPDKLDANLCLVPSSSRVPRMPQGFDWLKKATEDAKLVVIDTFERFRPSDLDGTRHSYSGDYAILEELKTWSEERSLAVLFSHHVRKNTKDAEDAFDTILGSSGIPGASDTLIVLHRTRGMPKGRLIAAGREVQHVEYPVRFDDGIWSIDMAAESDKRRLPPAEALAELLKGGIKMLSTDIQKLADEGKIHGHSFAVLQKAKAEAGVELESQGKQRLWHIPNMEQPRCDGVETT